MSLTIIAMTGILVGFLCLAVGFFMEEGNSHSVMSSKQKRGHRVHHRRMVAHHRRRAA